ncbi:Uncharacterised protein [Mycobacteroides abscessus]|nr:Uncharacterised protein [Mycobacteroides abscessus]
MSTVPTDVATAMTSVLPIHVQNIVVPSWA